MPGSAVASSTAVTSATHTRSMGFTAPSGRVGLPGTTRVASISVEIGCEAEESEEVLA